MKVLAKNVVKWGAILYVVQALFGIGIGLVYSNEIVEMLYHVVH